MTTEQNKPTVTRISRTRKELIAKYATAACFLYGIIDIPEFVKVFNRYEEDKTTAQETCLALERLARTDDVEYSLYDGNIFGPDFQPDFPDDLKKARIVKSHQKGKPRYLPEKDEFLRYFDPEYREPEKPYADLKAYILKNKLSTKKGIHGVDGDLMDLHEMIQADVEAAGILQYFVDKGYPFQNIDAINAFLQRLTDVMNNTRLFENNGFTPRELFEKHERPLMPMRK
ncbi:hypothetical protein LJC31_05810 [Synergistaceae bacterium OttesenSCG-928-I11]|nr:hypothetical protein [Synergistaceae bacterium OttesenSCG-928-I11]